jgi:hypothetical protein
MVTTLFALRSACFCSAASALAVFFWASRAARFCASSESDAVAAEMASGDQIRSKSVLSWRSSHSWHFLTVPPYSQYCERGQRAGLHGCGNGR